ncbi:DUF3592 domain-containing protein, partial [Cohnella soli]
SKITQGKVVDLIQRYVGNNTSGGRRKAFFPVIEYFDELEQCTKKFESNGGTSLNLSPQIGDEIKIRYLNHNGNTKAVIDSFFFKYGFSLLFILVGLLFSIIGIAIESNSGWSNFR